VTVLAALSVLVSTAATATAPPGMCFPAAVTPGPGVADPFHVAAPAAAQLNADGKVLYRQGRWDEARAKYRAAEAADPDFLAPALNVACSFVRQERFDEAVAEAKRLLERAYLPWSQEIFDAADMGALKVRPEGKGLRAALEAGRLHWADGLAGDLIFIARTRAPLKLGGGPAVAGAALVLGTRQEVFAWSPRTRRYRQLTSEEGRVLAVARSTDGRRIAYATAEKLIRGEDGEAAALRGVVVKELDLGTLAPLGLGVVTGDVRRLDIVALGPAGFGYRVERAGAPFTFRLADGRLDVAPVAKGAPAAVTLTAKGVAPRPKAVRSAGDCAAIVTDVVAADGSRRVHVQPARSKLNAAILGGPFGAGTFGLPLDLLPPDDPKN
jgi:hypothetical protein